MFWVIFIYAICTIFIGIGVFETFWSNLGWSAVLAPLIALSVGSTARSSFYGDRNFIVPRLLIAFSVLAGAIIWINYTGYRVIAFDVEIPGWLWVTIGFVVGFLFTPKKLSLENIGTT